ncbi:hypothetical protein [Hymenobacter arizonensis]|uniref:Type I restriction enzyme R protein N terminus (HSDR_N) n=1 Tax=Hymenobacter arizonensis TaxID=1227077 RepID=A0A1I5Y8S4_HYMAR|nr:hypothetical protein [Hymenobacter arizonensis]SFQ40605.1 hypothetical protein SAMN04515668_2300 [Hymenobacter arizonensis]
MPHSSPVAAIYQVLQQVQANAETNVGIFQKNEAATRAALIDPVLRAVGWDTTNVRMVEPEKTLSNELRIDYLLNDPAGKPWIVVEAKCLGSSLDKYGYVGKILGYAISLNVHTVCITDGLTWHIHSHLQNGKPEPIVFTLAKNDFLSAANELIRWLDAARCGHGLPPAAQETAAAPAIEIPLAKPVSKQSAKPKHLLQPEMAFTNVAQVHQLKLLPGQKPK